MVGRHGGQSGKLALGGILASGALVMLWLAGVAPSGRLGLTAVGGLFPMVATLTAGRKAGYLCWSTAGLLGLVILPDKGTALLFLIFFGLYPVLKGAIESLRHLPLEWALKLVCFNAVLTISWFMFRGLFLPNPPQWLEENSLLLYGLGNVVFVMYDIGLSRLIAMLQVSLGFGHRGGRK